MDSMNFSAHASTDGGDADADAGEISTQSNQRKRKRISKVWEDFNPFNDAEGREMAKCKHCGKALVAASIKGTSHLIKHLRTCRKKSAGMADDDGIGSQDAENRTTFDFWYDQSRYNQAVQKSELDQYLDEPKIRRNAKFDILQWWKVNSDKLPILGRMARDVLAVPATTVASESAFSIGGRVIDETRNCLLPDIVENLITTADWIPRNQDVSPTDEV